jgi:FAD synthase
VVEPVRLLRRQERFADLAALTAQIASDADQSRQCLAPLLSASGRRG